MNLEVTVRAVMAAYNYGDAEPLISTFAPDVEYTIVDLGKTYKGLGAVTALANDGAGVTRFHLKEVIVNGPLVTYTYDHENPLAGISYHGPGLAVQRYNDHGQLTAHWAYRA
ncbi:nuclear transport factor 2 family protein [Arthrobacter sp. PM3]|uniref:nuclear transport factor 2 family protein n=1 Tax=Arthrobacter sp. PM3 TaxID=2017685 RepID=UPI000E1090AD|nr:nuclear transport factor 2 family protein [Arthrobacter sp. PM3]AXJ10870.1 hypothetical protein CFN17_15570 [Arthrobacter sp. PM3]